MNARLCVLVCAALLIPPVCGSASDTAAGVSLALGHVIHRETDGTIEIPIAPIPVINVSQRLGRLQLAAEGLPPLGPIPVNSNGLGVHDFALSYADATLRYWNGPHTFAVGIGESLYTQRTNFAVLQNFSMRANDTSNSRVVGSEFEIIARMHANAQDVYEMRLAVNPKMHGRFSYTSPNKITSPSSETASEVDIAVRYVHQMKALSVSYGMRYLNYTAGFNQKSSLSFADTNSLLMPYVQVERFFGP